MRHGNSPGMTQRIATWCTHAARATNAVDSRRMATAHVTTQAGTATRRRTTGIEIARRRATGTGFARWRAARKFRRIAIRIRIASRRAIGIRIARRRATRIEAAWHRAVRTCKAAAKEHVLATAAAGIHDGKLAESGWAHPHNWPIVRGVNGLGLEHIVHVGRTTALIGVVATVGLLLLGSQKAFDVHAV